MRSSSAGFSFMISDKERCAPSSSRPTTWAAFLPPSWRGRSPRADRSTSRGSRIVESSSSAWSARRRAASASSALCKSVTVPDACSSRWSAAKGACRNSVSPGAPLAVQLLSTRTRRRRPLSTLSARAVAERERAASAWSSFHSRARAMPGSFSRRCPEPSRTRSRACAASFWGAWHSSA